jgi:hypothetical protein
LFTSGHRPRVGFSPVFHQDQEGRFFSYEHLRQPFQPLAGNLARYALIHYPPPDQTLQNRQITFPKRGPGSEGQAVTEIIFINSDARHRLFLFSSVHLRFQVPVILATAKSNGDAVAEGLEVGTNDYLTKLFEIRELKPGFQRNFGCGVWSGS